MRAYFFGNMYLSSIQQGIQALHATAEMFMIYGDPEKPNYHSVREWANDHKTVVLLNAGYSSEILSLAEFFTREDNPYPWAAFNEDPLALGVGLSGEPGASTCIGIILPERIYETVALIRKGAVQRQLLNTAALATFARDYDIPDNFNDWELDMIDRLPQYGLAR